MRTPLSSARIEAGDQLFVRGPTDAIASFAARARLLKIDRLNAVTLASRRAALTVGILAVAIIAIVAGGTSPAIVFLAAAAAAAALGLLPGKNVYSAVGWSAVVLLTAMLPVGRSFETSGAAGIAADMAGRGLDSLPLPVVLAALCGLASLLSVFLNNVAIAIMGPLAIDTAHLLGLHLNAALLCVLIGASTAFLPPIGHQNNLLVMGRAVTGSPPKFD